MMDIKNISSYVSYYAGKHPQKTFIIADNRKYSYQEVDGLINNVCALLKTLRINKGTVLSALLKNSVEYIVFYLGAMRYGCTINPNSYEKTTADLVDDLNFIRPDAVICHPEHYEELKEATDLDLLLVGEAFIDYIQKFNETFVAFEPLPDDPACIYRSSNTLDDFKGVVVSHGNIMQNISSFTRGMKCNDDEKHLLVLPFDDPALINYSILPCTFCGGTLVVTESYDSIKTNFWTLVKKHNITFVEMRPSMLEEMLDLPYYQVEYEDISSLKFIGCNAERLQKELQMKFMDAFGVKVANLYGYSETGPTHIDNPLDENWVPGSIGTPLDINEVRIVDEDGNDLGPGQVGEITIKGENVFKGYYKNESMYKKRVVDNYFHTGDLGYVDHNNRFYLVESKNQ